MNGRLELAKWIALACMVIDHTNKVLFGGELGVWADILGRVAFPVFALVLGINLARQGIDLQRIAARLALIGAIATPFYAPILGVLPLNVFATFLAAVAVIALVRQDKLGWAVVVGVLSGLVVDYGHAGIAMVLAGWNLGLCIQMRGKVYRAIGLVFLAVALGMLCHHNGNVWAVVGLAGVGVLLLPRWEVPRLRWAFYAAYPAHLAVLLAIAVGV